mgnify:CR=1 FL=1
MKFIGDEAQTVSSGEYNYNAVIGTGAITLTMSLNSGPFIAVPDGAFTADDAGLIVFATCRVKAGLTSNASFVMNNTKS